MKKRIIIFSVVLSAFVSLFVAGKVLAQSSQVEGIQISPLTFNFEIQPGQTETGTIYVTNKGSAGDMNYVTETEDFRDTSEDGAPSFEGIKKQEGVSMLSDWIEVTSNAEGTLSPEQTVQVDFKITVPEDAEPGGHYAALFAKQVKGTDGGANEVGVVSRVGALILVSVPGNVTKTAQIVEFKTPKIVWWGPVNFSMKVENTGSVHYDSEGKITIDPMFGSNKEVDLGTHTILPKNKRSYEGSWQNKVPFGYYKLTASATDGDGNEVMAQSAMIAIPLIIVIPVILLIILIWLLVKYFKSHYQRTAATPGGTQNNIS